MDDISKRLAIDEVRHDVIKLGEETKFYVDVRNKERVESAEFGVYAYLNDDLIGYDGREDPLPGGRTKEVDLFVTIDEPGTHKIIFKCKMGGRNGETIGRGHKYVTVKSRPQYGDVQYKYVTVKKRDLEDAVGDLSSHPFDFIRRASTAYIVGAVFAAAKKLVVGVAGGLTLGYFAGVLDFSESQMRNMINEMENNGADAIVFKVKYVYKRGPNSKLGTGWYPVYIRKSGYQY